MAALGPLQNTAAIHGAKTGPGAVAGRQPAEATVQRAPIAHRGAPLRGGLQRWDQRLNSDLANAQQTLDFLDQSAAQLQSLKLELGARLAGQRFQEGQLQAKIQRFAETWDGRHERTGASLDPQLQYSPGAATQRFSVRGLDMATLQAGEAETLALSTRSGSAPVTVRIDAGMTATAVVQRLDAALAPAGIRASAGESGELVFSTAEADWEALRSALAIKGDGIRFPAGQFNRVRAEPEAPAIRPDTWDTGEAAALRRVLQQVAQGLEQIMHAREMVSRILAEAVQRAHEMQRPEDPAQLSMLAQEFARLGERQDYPALSSILPALAGISRTRVLSLLALSRF